MLKLFDASSQALGRSRGVWVWFAREIRREKEKEGLHVLNRTDGMACYGTTTDWHGMAPRRLSIGKRIHLAALAAFP